MREREGEYEILLEISVIKMVISFLYNFLENISCMFQLYII